MLERPRPGQRYVGGKACEDAALRERMLSIPVENPRYGYRRVWASLRREGWEANKRRVQRLWREAGLEAPREQRKERRLAPGASEDGRARRRAERVNHVWSCDFAMDQTDGGGRSKAMPIVGEHSRERLALEIERSITASDVIETLDRLLTERGEPEYIRSDNGPEFIAGAIKRWLAACGVKTLYVEPGSPWENAYSETFISRLRDEPLEREVSASLKEAKALAEDHRGHYNHHRPHGALGYLTPAEFAELEKLPLQNSGAEEEVETLQCVSRLPS